MEARAIYDFRASQPDELTFKQGDVLKILQNQRVIIFFENFVIIEKINA